MRIKSKKLVKQTFSVELVRGLITVPLQHSHTLKMKPQEDGSDRRIKFNTLIVLDDYNDLIVGDKISFFAVSLALKQIDNNICTYVSPGITTAI